MIDTNLKIFASRIANLPSVPDDERITLVLGKSIKDINLSSLTIFMQACSGKINLADMENDLEKLIEKDDSVKKAMSDFENSEILDPKLFKLVKALAGTNQKSLLE